MEEYSYWATAKAAIPWHENRAYERVASEAIEASREQQLPESRFGYAVEQLYDAYGDFLYAMNPMEVEPGDHVHWHNHFRDARLGKKMGEPPISQEVLSGAAYKYLKGPLRVPLMDRGLLDAFIAQETFAYIDRQAGRGAFMTQLGCLGFYVVFVVVGAMLFGDSDTNWTRFWQIVGGLLVLMVVAWAWPKRGPYALYREMRDTYQLLTGSVVSVAELRRRIERARDKGVVWPAELYAVLDDVEARTKVL